jgi:hypothetical protein
VEIELIAIEVPPTATHVSRKRCGKSGCGGGSLAGPTPVRWRPLGEHLGQLLEIGWSVTLSSIIIRSRVLPRWLGVVGLLVSVI